jgi:hypothetical protein
MRAKRWLTVRCTRRREIEQNNRIEIFITNGPYLQSFASERYERS